MGQHHQNEEKEHGPFSKKSGGLAMSLMAILLAIPGLPATLFVAGAWHTAGPVLVPQVQYQGEGK
ncbi:hypothetical protein FP026_27475 [Rhizobium tropici]|uniref:Uncharacterized protein n=1 Tax=Rhizobium tropici TaxID=398 RepID=A0A5B0VPF1_RHITR|nr:hypothetical protein FP026_27475 [Rhizobium tropici]